MPIARLTATNVRTLRARGGKRTDYTDALLPGFVLRVSPTGARSYAVKAHRDGRSRRITIGPTARYSLAKARDLARAIIAALDAGEEPPPTEVAGHALTVKGLVTRCLDDLSLRGTTRREWERLARVEILPALGPRRAASLLRSEVRAWVREIRHRSAHTARHSLEVLRRCYSWGIREDLLEANPCLGIDAPKGDSGSRVLSAEELWALQRALDRGARRFPAYASATRLLLLTGVRRAAVLGLRRDELHGLDGPEPRWVVPAVRSKSGREQVVPLSPQAVQVVQARLEAVTTRHLYPLGHGADRQELPTGWAGRWRSWLRWRLARALYARRRAQGMDRSRWRDPVPRWRIHDLRHTLATHLREDLGISRDVVSLILGHAMTGPSITAIYDRAELLPARRAALCAWARWLQDASTLK